MKPLRKAVAAAGGGGELPEIHLSDLRGVSAPNNPNFVQGNNGGGNPYGFYTEYTPAADTLITGVAVKGQTYLVGQTVTFEVWRVDGARVYRSPVPVTVAAPDGVIGGPDPVQLRAGTAYMIGIAGGTTGYDSCSIIYNTVRNDEPGFAVGPSCDAYNIARQPATPAPPSAPRSFSSPNSIFTLMRVQDFKPKNVVGPLDPADLPADLTGLPARVAALEAEGAVYAAAALSAPQSIPATTWTKINLDRTTTMTDAKFVAPHDGTYLASASVVFLGGGGMYANAAIRRNGEVAVHVGEDSLAGTALALTATGAIKLKQGDVLELYAYAGSGCDVYGGVQDSTAFNVISAAGGSSGAGSDVSSWPVMVAAMDQGTMNGNGGWALSGNTFATVPVTKILDTHADFDDATHSYVVPQDGVYRIEMKLRLSDTTGGGRSYGIGVDKTNTDNAAFLWGVSNASRNGLINQRLMTLKAGDRLSLYAYSDNPINVIAAEFSVDRIR